MMLCQVVLSCITNYKDNDCILIQSFRNFHCSREIRTGGAATEYPFHSTKAPRHFKRISIGKIDDFINILDVNVRWDNLLTNSFDQIRSCLDEFSGLLVGLKNRSIRIRTDDSYAWILLF